MWPWAHLALGYLLFSVYTRWRYGRPPVGEGLIALAVATQLPDFIDKPLAYWIGVFPTGRALFHSLLVGLPVLVALGLVARRYRSPAATGFGIGYASHFVGDFWYQVLQLEIGETTLFWPVIPAPSYETGSFVEHYRELVSVFSMSDPLAGVSAFPWFYGQIAFTVLVFGLWWYEGKPGIERTVSRVSRSLPR